MIKASATRTALQAAENPQLVESESQLAEAAEIWSQCPALGIDTEFLRERTYRAELGLVQVSDGQTSWLIDPIRSPQLQPLKHLFSNAGQVKILHSASEDLEVLLHTLGVVPDPMVDTQIACAMLGQPLQMSYHNAVKWMFGFEVDKGQTRSNWIRRPLRPEQLHYAAVDVVFLPLMLQQLQAELEQMGRWEWLCEEINRMLDNCREVSDPSTAYLRFKGLNRLDTAAAHTLRALAAWREQTAMDKNLARGFVLKDPVLMQIAQRQPESLDDLKKIDGLHPRDLERHGAKVLELVAQNRQANGPIEQVEALDTRQKKLLDAMRNAVAKKAKELNIDPALLASRKLLEALLREYETHGTVPERFSGWRQSIITDQLLDLAARSLNR